MGKPVLSGELINLIFKYSEFKISNNRVRDQNGLYNSRITNIRVVIIVFIRET